MDAEKNPSAPSPKPARRRLRRVLIVLLALLVVIVVGLPVAWYYLGGKLRWSEPYRAALARLKEDPQVIQRLGEPIKDASRFGLPSGWVAGENAHLTFEIGGPKGRASVRTEARVFSGQWALRALEVTFADGKRVSVETSSGGEGEAPKWTPAPAAPPQAPKEPPKTRSPASSEPNIQLDLPDLGPAEGKTRDTKTPPK